MTPRNTRIKLSTCDADVAAPNKQLAPTSVADGMLANQTESETSGQSSSPTIPDERNGAPEAPPADVAPSASGEQASPEQNGNGQATPPAPSIPAAGEVAPPTPAAPPVKRMSIYPRQPLPAKIVELIQKLESLIKAPVFVLVQLPTQDDRTEARWFHKISEAISYHLIFEKPTLPEGQKPVVLIDSPGGHARAAYRIAAFFRRNFGGFDAIIPLAAKSAATLLALGADRIMLGAHGELGPLDAQWYDPDREKHCSGLDEYLSVQAISKFAQATVHSMFEYCRNEYTKRFEVAFPPCAEFASRLSEPLLSKIDAVHWSDTSRTLQVARKYAERLLQKHYPRTATEIARKLVEEYPDHEYCIDADEVNRIGLKTTDIPDDVYDVSVGLLAEFYQANLSAVGFMQDV